jgi:hypothetical protein
MTDECGKTLAILNIPYFGGFIEATSGDFVPVRVVEAQTVYNIFMALKCKDFLACLGGP